MRPVDGLILDFDGTLAPEVPEVAIGILHDTLCQWAPVPLPMIRQYFRCLSAFPLEQSLGLLLDAVGLGDKLAPVGAALMSCESWGSWTVDLDPGAEAFVKARPSGSLKVFSAGGTRAPRFAPAVKLLGADAFLAYPGCSKANPKTWKTMTEDFGWDPGRRVVVDDSPPALWAAKSAGYVTVLRLNTVFGESDWRDFQQWIDYRVSSFQELGRRFKPPHGEPA